MTKNSERFLAITQLSIEIANLAHQAWEDKGNVQFLFRSIEQRATAIQILANTKKQIVSTEKPLDINEMLNQHAGGSHDAARAEG